MKFEMVVEGNGLLPGFGDEMDSDLNFKLAPAGFGKLKRWFVKISRRIGIGVVQLECYAFDEVAEIVCPPNYVRVWCAGSTPYC